MCINGLKSAKNNKVPLAISLHVNLGRYSTDPVPVNLQKTFDCSTVLVPEGLFCQGTLSAVIVAIVLHRLWLEEHAFVYR